jgi:hypothetical protein
VLAPRLQSTRRMASSVSVGRGVVGFDMLVSFIYERLRNVNEELRRAADRADHGSATDFHGSRGSCPRADPHIVRQVAAAQRPASTGIGVNPRNPRLNRDQRHPCIRGKSRTT